MGGLFKTAQPPQRRPFKGVARPVSVSLRRGPSIFPEERGAAPLPAQQERRWGAAACPALPCPPRARGAPLGCAAAGGLFYVPAAPHRPGLAGSAPRGAICGPPEQKQGGGAAPPPFCCGAGAAAGVRGWCRCRGHRRDSLGEASGVRRGRGRRRPCLDAGPAAEPTRVRAVRGAGLASPSLPTAEGPSGEGRGGGPVPPHHRPG